MPPIQRLSTDTGLEALNVMDEALTVETFGPEFDNLQGEWRPLSDEYRDWKESQGYPPEIFELTGASRAALSAHEPFGMGGGGVGAREVQVLENTGAQAEAVMIMKAPAASYGSGGMSANPDGTGYFGINNRQRPWMTAEIAMRNIAYIRERVLSVYIEALRQMGFS